MQVPPPIELRKMPAQDEQAVKPEAPAHACARASDSC